MRSMWRGVRVIVVAAAPMLLAACGAPDGPCGDEDCESIASSKVVCESFGCGGNARISGSIIHELKVPHPRQGAVTAGMTSEPNEQGLFIQGFRSGAGAAHRLPIGTSMDLDVEGDRLLGRLAGQPAVEGAELEGATIDLLSSSGYSVPVHIEWTGETDFWVSAPAGPARTSVYKLTTMLPTGILGSICDELPAVSGTISVDDDIDPAELAVVFEGDRYNSHSGIIEIPGKTGWFNIACVGTALAKMHLLRHTSAGNGSTSSPSWEQRQAMLRLLSADYCGDGDAYARNGTPLLFEDQDGRFRPNAPSGNIESLNVEAIWTAAGALCLDDPRSWDTWRSHAELRAHIVAACQDSPVETLRRTIPRCTAGQLASWRSLGPISANPP
jgi:hypothetical protein